MSRLNAYNQPIGPELADWRPPKAPSRRTLAGRFCLVEPLDPERHGRELFDANLRSADARSFTYLPFGPFESYESYEAWLRADCLSDDPMFFAIVDAQTGKATGVAAYQRVAPASGSIEVGHLNFSPLLKRRPAATEAMFLMMRHAFELGYRRYEWKCDALNAPSRTAAERLGFRYEGTFRNATVYKGRSRDTAWFSIIDAEWPLVERAFVRWLAPENFDETGAQRTRLSELTRDLRAR